MGLTKWLTVIVLFTIFASFSQVKSADFKRLIQQYKNSKALENSQWALLAIDADNGQIIIDHQSKFALAPASCQKLITTGVALKLLGADFRFKTQILADGKITRDGMLNGNLIIKGNGDPTLGSNIVKGSLPLDSLMLSWLQDIKQKGVRTITGNIIADLSLFEPKPVPDDWMWVDLGNYYGASSPALTIHDNLYYLIFRPGIKEAEPTQILGTRPVIPGLIFENHVLTGAKGSGDNAYIFCAPGQFKASVFGTIPAGVDSFKIKGSIPDPALFAVQRFLTILMNNGITVKGKAVTTTSPVPSDNQILLTESISPPLKDIIEQTNKRSINLYCELLVKTLSVVRNGKGNTSQGLEIIEQTLKEMGVNTNGLHLSDGSGLAPTNAITPRAMVEFLNAMRNETCFEDYLNSISLAGDPNDVGYFKKWGLGTPLARNARIKSGLIEGVRSHSGYLKDQNGHWIIFSFIANHFKGHYTQIDKIHEKLLILLSERFAKGRKNNEN